MKRWSTRGWFELAFLVVKPKMLGMEKVITASEANQRFSEMLRDVAEGDSFTVLSRGRPVARVTSVDREERRQAMDRLFAFLATLPQRQIKPYTREELYERDEPRT